MDTLKSLPYGSLIRYRNKLYFKSKGIEQDILTDVNGRWFFIDEFNWFFIDEFKRETFVILYSPEQ